MLEFVVICLDVIEVYHCIRDSDLMVFEEVQLRESLLCSIKQELVAFYCDSQQVLLHHLIVQYRPKLFDSKVQEKSLDTALRSEVEVCAQRSVKLHEGKVNFVFKLTASVSVNNVHVCGLEVEGNRLGEVELDLPVCKLALSAIDGLEYCCLMESLNQLFPESDHLHHVAAHLEHRWRLYLLLFVVTICFMELLINRNHLPGH